MRETSKKEKSTPMQRNKARKTLRKELKAGKSPQDALRLAMESMKSKKKDKND